MKRLAGIFGLVALVALAVLFAFPQAAVSDPVRVRVFTTLGTDNTSTAGFVISKETTSVLMCIDNTLATTKVHVNLSMDNAATYAPFHTIMGNAATTTLWETVSGTAKICVPWPQGLVNGRWFKIVCADNQTAPVQFSIYERAD